MQNLITQNLDIWTAAQAPKNNVGRGGGKNGNGQTQYGINKLRELILDLAVRGNLVPQYPEDEPASVLLEKIAKEKARLIKEGKIKKQKKLPEILEGEKPFELPNGWAWARWNAVAEKIGDIDHKMPVQVQNGYPYISPRDFLPNNKIDFKNAKKISEKDFLRLSTKIQPQKWDIIYPRYGTIGENRLVTTEELFLASYSCCVIKTMKGYIVPKYQFIYSISQLTKKQAKNAENKTTQANVGIKSIQNYIMPIPPFSEQHRIVAKVDELMALCDQLEQQQEDTFSTHQSLVKTVLDTLIKASDHNEFIVAWQRISNHFDTLFTTEQSIDQLKQTILQLAVMGKLVSQDPDDEPASVLLEKIAKEKARLIKEGIIKKQKKLPEIAEDEKPFELPESWEWERLGLFTSVGTGGTPDRKNLNYYSPPEFNWVTSGETRDLFISETKEKISKLAVEKSNVTIYPVGTLIIAMYGQGKTRGQISELLIEAGTNQACAAIQAINQDEYHRRYIKLFFQKAYEEIRKQAAGGAQPNLNVGKVSNTIIPVPPLKEQKRIVEQVDELMAICDKLKSRINNAQTIQNQLADTIIEQAVV